MKKHSNRLLAFLLVIGMLFCMTACGGGDTADDTSSGSSTENNASGSNGEETVSSKDTLVLVSPTTDTGNYSP